MAPPASPAAWDAVARDVEASLSEEARREEEEANRRLGIDTKAPKSAREASERDKDAELKKAKGELDAKEKEKEGRTVYVDDESGEERTLDLEREMKDAEAMPPGPVVVHFRRCRSGTYVVPAHDRPVTKVFIEGCEDCTFDFRCRVITAFCEVWKSSAVVCRHQPPETDDPAALRTLSTYQLDDVRTIALHYPSRDHFLSVIHHNASKLSVSFDDGSDGLDFEGEASGGSDDTNAADATGIDNAGAASRPDAPVAQSPYDPNRYQQLLSRFVDGRALTERVVRTEAGAFPTTTREMGSAAGAAVDGARAAEQKARGNECFTSMAYAQAAVYYTEALALDPSLTACLANRAACWLKLGTPEKAVADAEACVAQDPENPKAHFRMGLGHHAMGAYRRAIDALVKAERFAPANAGPMRKQISDAIRMAQLMLRRRGEADDAGNAGS